MRLLLVSFLELIVKVWNGQTYINLACCNFIEFIDEFCFVCLLWWHRLSFLYIIFCHLKKQWRILLYRIGFLVFLNSHLIVVKNSAFTTLVTKVGIYTCILVSKTFFSFLVHYNSVVIYLPYYLLYSSVPSLHGKYVDTKA